MNLSPIKSLLASGPGFWPDVSGVDADLVCSLPLKTAPGFWPPPGRIYMAENENMFVFICHLVRGC
jgi:hypothetical protein